MVLVATNTGEVVWRCKSFLGGWERGYVDSNIDIIDYNIYDSNIFYRKLREIDLEGIPGLRSWMLAVGHLHLDTPRGGGAGGHWMPVFPPGREERG